MNLNLNWEVPVALSPLASGLSVCSHALKV
jgi:hypothetical protein